MEEYPQWVQSLINDYREAYGAVFGSNARILGIEYNRGWFQLTSFAKEHGDLVPIWTKSVRTAHFHKMIETLRARAFQMRKQATRQETIMAVFNQMSGKQQAILEEAYAQFKDGLEDDVFLDQRLILPDFLELITELARIGAFKNSLQEVKK
jgi:hypothetical protein